MWVMSCCETTLFWGPKYVVPHCELNLFHQWHAHLFHILTWTTQRYFDQKMYITNVGPTSSMVLGRTGKQIKIPFGWSLGAAWGLQLSGLDIWRCQSWQKSKRLMVWLCLRMASFGSQVWTIHTNSSKRFFTESFTKICQQKTEWATTMRLQRNNCKRGERILTSTDAHKGSLNWFPFTNPKDAWPAILCFMWVAWIQFVGHGN